MNEQYFYGLKVVIVNWCKASDTIECIQSLLQADVPINCILIVDNGSNDGSSRRVADAFPEVEILELQENLGFAGGYNFGIGAALKRGADKIMLLNNDTIVDKDAISILYKSGWDVSVPKIYYQKPAGLIWSAGARWRRIPPMVIMRGYQKQDSAHYSYEMELEYATGCALMVNCRVFETVGMFDEEFRNYFEDYDFIFRVRKAGFRVGYIPSAIVWHKVSQSFGDESPQKYQFIGKNSVLFYRKEHRFPLWVLFSYIAWVSVREISKFKFSQIRAFWTGIQEGMDWIRHGASTL